MPGTDHGSAQISFVTRATVIATESTNQTQEIHSRCSVCGGRHGLYQRYVYRITPMNKHLKYIQSKGSFTLSVADRRCSYDVLKIILTNNSQSKLNLLTSVCLVHQLQS